MPFWFCLILLAVPLMVGCNAGCSKRPEPPLPTGLPAVRAILDLPEEQIDLAKAKVTIDQMIDPSIDIAKTLTELDEMAERTRARFHPNASTREKVEVLRAQIYEPGPWNGNQPFQYDLDDPYGRAIRSKLVSTYLATRKGNCVSMPLLFIVLGQKLGLDLTASTAPEHVFVKYRDETGEVFNLEATSGAGFTSEAWMLKNMPMTPEALSNGVFLRRHTKKETVVVMLTTLMEFYGKEDRQEERVALAALALKYDPRNVSAMLHISAAHGQVMEREYMRRFATPADIPIPERARFVQLNEGIGHWRQKAEALGWREPDAATNTRYEEAVNAAKSAR